MTSPLASLAGLSLAEIAALADGASHPPVARWHPPHCGDSGMRIARDGRWFHDGDEIRRPELVRLFASILRREADGRHLLVTPGEMLDIAVEDAAFIAVELASEGSGRARRIALRLNTGDLVVLGRAHPLRVVDTAAGPRPYVAVRDGLEALVARPVYYELAAIVLDEGEHGVWSDGQFFALGAAA